MINFDEEIKKYKPIMELNDIEESSKDDETADMLSLLQYIASKDKKESFS